MMDVSKKIMKQVSLVAFYGKKPPEFEAFISACQNMTAEALLGDFLPYDIQQVHSTIIGLEQVEGSDGINLNFLRFRNQYRQMQIQKFIRFIRTSEAFPFQIQVAGFHEGFCGFTSRRKSPFERSFLISESKAVVIGWPAQHKRSQGETYPNTLDQLRQKAQEFNVLHRYHSRSDDVDNDFYFRLGVVTNSHINLSIENHIRAQLSRHAPLKLEVSLENLFLVSYADESLPPETTRAIPITEINLDVGNVVNLYQ